MTDPSHANIGARLPHWIFAPALAAFLLAGCGGGGDRVGKAGSDESPGAEELTAESFWTTWRDTVRNGDTLWDILDRNQVYIADINRFLSRATGEHVAWRRLKPGQVLEGAHDELGSLRRMLYVKSREEVFRIELDGDSLWVDNVEVEKEIHLRRLRAVVNLTVDGALRRAGGDGTLLREIADVLSWDVDFYADPRKGDTLDVLVEEIEIEGEFYRFGDIQRIIYTGGKVKTDGTRYQRNGKDHAEYFDRDGRNLRKSFLKSPIRYSRISSRFSRRRFHPILRVYRPHLGVDYAAPVGTPVVAIADGEVIQAGWNGGFGNFIKIRHNASVSTGYGHLRAYAKGLRRGTRVRQGETIGYVGSTGLSTGPHLDFRVIRDGRYIDPLKMKNPPASPLTEEELPKFQAQRARLVALMESLDPGERSPIPEPVVLAAEVGGGGETAR